MQTKYHLHFDYLFDPITFCGIKLFQIGRMHCAPSGDVGRHDHLRWYELTAVTEGRGTVVTNGEEFSVEKGDIYLSIPADSHMIKSSRDEPLKFNFIALYPDDPETEAAFGRVSGERISPRRRVIKNGRLEDLIAAALDEFCRRDDYRDEIFGSMLKEIVFLTLRCYGKDDSDDKARANSAEEICYRIMHRIDTNIYSAESLSSLSEVFGYNYSYLSNLFRKTTGGTIAGYLRNSRLEAARLMLAEGKLNCGEIAEALGYASLFSFSRSFKQKYGVSPKRYASADAGNTDSEK